MERQEVKLRLTIVDTPGFGDGLDSSECYLPITDYINAQFEKFFTDESGLNRRNIVDNRTHCCLFFINPVGHALKPLDIEVMKQLHNKVNLVPVIAKADTLTKSEVETLKATIRADILRHGISVYQLPTCDTEDNEEFRQQVKQLQDAMPFAVCGSSTVIEVQGRRVRGRQYPWGVVDIENPTFCDFTKLRTMLITHMQDMEDMTHDMHYETYRSARLAAKSAGSHQAAPGELSEKDRILREKEEELKRMQDMLSKMQAQMAQSSTSSLHSTDSH